MTTVKNESKGVGSLLHRLQHAPGPEDQPRLDQRMRFLEDPLTVSHTADSPDSLIFLRKRRNLERSLRDTGAGTLV